MKVVTVQIGRSVEGMITNILSCMILGDNEYVDADTGDCDDVGALQLLLVGQRRKANLFLFHCANL